MRALFSIFLALLCLNANAVLKLPALIGDHAVLQRGAKIPVWGWAAPGEKISIAFKGKNYSVVTAADGKWNMQLAASNAGGPYEMKISTAEQSITLHDILIGDVFLCSGQSNMEYGIDKNLYIKEIQASANPEIRQFKVNRQSADTVRNDILLHTGWLSASPATLARFSAVAYFYAAALFEKYKVPIGVINTSYGSSLAEAWISREGLTEFPDFLKQPKLPSEQSNPTKLFNAMLSPLTHYNVKGVLWYQGEFNANRAFQYRRLLPALINDWRKHFDKKELPFIIVQLPNYNKIQPQLSGSAIAELREAQAMAAIMLNVDFVSTIDINANGDLHPKEKKPIGNRVALMAQQLIYHEKIQASGPRYAALKIDGNKAIVSFTKRSGQIKPVDSINNFIIAGADGKFYPAKAITIKNTIEVFSPNVPTPVAVRYCWADNPPDVNLYNLEGLPASPFRTDDWPGLTAPKNTKPNKP
ncbi:sialate O-acetylesterase [Pedobacter sp. UBA5917]|jgi:sialate O-acetylesterase|uniref:sialate O-acetylesterase n=1 Tax=Pedobacter sp. UBA5917 TaxID=1947061 RepID=UPI0025ED9D4B|nr:sialate O-acetylesterase [Pedobacter sp. UBA5917]